MSIEIQPWERLRKMHIVQIDIIRQFVSICEKEKLKYFIIGGTLLGAVRENGFIPWDDDVDIAMPREDYEKFMEVADKHLDRDYKLLNPKKSEEYFYFIPRLICSKMKVNNNFYYKKRVEDVSIDIFPLDGMPDPGVKRFAHQVSALFLRALYKFSVFDTYVAVDHAKRTWYERVLVYFCKKLNLQKKFSVSKRLFAYDKCIRKYSYKNSKYLMNYMGAYKYKEMFPKEIFGKGRIYEFENMHLLGPSDSDTYLKQLYGDYMMMPSKREKNKHCIEVID